MKLSNTINNKTILFPLEATSKQKTIESLLHHCIEVDLLKSSSKLNLYLNDKDKIFNSAAGRGIAYHYNTSVEVQKIISILGISKDGIDYNAEDGLLCNFILLVLEPQDQPTQHRKFINLFQDMMHSPSTKAKLVEAQSKEEIIQIIKDWEIKLLEDDII